MDMLSATDLDLRDWLAGQALAGILMHPSTPTAGDTPLEQHALSLAEQAYIYADAMMKERRRKQPDPAAELAGSRPSGLPPGEAVARPAPNARGVRD
jgi:hypothetical protein